MASFCLALFMIAVFICRASGNFNHSIGPLAACKTDMEDARQYTEACYRRCKRNERPTTHGFTYLYSDTSPTGGPMVTSCSKLRLKQTFTETWTFSQIASSVTQEELVILRDECESTIKKLCPTHNCSSKLPNSLQPEYHYASDTSISRDFVVLISMPSGVDYMESDTKITPAMTDKSFPLADGYGMINKKWYLWNPATETGVCPFSQSQSHGCDAYGDPITLINCRRSRFVIPDVDHAKQLNKPCGHIWRSTTGLLYSWQVKNEMTTDASKRIALTAVQNENDQVALLRTGVTNALNVLDEDLCFTQCELLDTVLRIDRKREVLTRIGGSYLLVTKTGYVRKCNPLVGCHLITPHKFCGNPNRVGVICQGKVYMWNPLKGYVEDGGDCNHHIEGSKFSVSVGNHQYHVDDSLHIELPDSEYFGISHDPMASSEDKISKEIVDPSDIRNSWESFKADEQSMAPIFIKENKTVENWGEGMTWGYINFGFIGRVISDICGRVTWWFTFFMTIIVLILGFNLLKWMRKTPESHISPSVTYNRAPTSATWL
ncbi:TPA_asm: G [Hedera alphacytorhabdovirus 1]|nr:TPA_asm: G [Hedera alphacytorhabdovirus 1]